MRLLLLFLLTSYHVIGQKSFTVVKVEGRLFLKGAKTSLIQGDKIAEESELIFGSKTTKAVLISSKGERYIVKSDGNSKEKPGEELMCFLRNVLLPLKKIEALTNRGTDQESVVDLKNYFGTKKFLILGNVESVKIDKPTYPVNDNFYFHMVYKCGSEKYNVPLPYDGSFIQIRKHDFPDSLCRFASEASRDNIMKLYYHDNSRSDSKLITSFCPVFLEEKQFKQECLVQMIILRQIYKDDKIVYENLLSYIYEYYDNFNKKTIDGILNNLMREKK